MPRYYTRVCNFYYGAVSKNLIKKKKAFPLNGNDYISFDQIEIISRQSKKKISISKIDRLPSNVRKKIKIDLKQILKKKKIKNLKLKK